MPTKTYITSWKYDPIRLSVKHLPQGLTDAGTLTSGSTVAVQSYVTTAPSIPGWRARLRDGLGCTTSLEGTKVVGPGNAYSAAVMTCERRDPSGKVFTRVYDLYGPLCAPGGIGSPPSLDTSHLVDAERMARLYFLKRVKKALQSIQLGVTLGELGETLRMIKNPANALYKGCYDYLDTVKKRSRRRRNRKKVKDIVAESWLEYSFGWVPLINDIEDGAKALGRLQNSKTRKKVNGNGEWQANGDVRRQENKPYPGVGPVFKITSAYRDKTIVRWRYHGLINLVDKDHSAFTNQLGLNPKDLVPTIWELIPYSFLVDYFSNIGNLLHYWSIQKSAIRWAEYGHKAEITRTYDVPVLTEVIVPSGWSLVSKGFNPGTTVSTSRRSVKREAASPAVSLADLQFEIPGIWSKKTLNVVALAAASRRTSRQISQY